MVAFQRVCVAMSGGVDSTSAALLLLRQGYEVFGVTLRLRPDCSGAQDMEIEAARAAARTLGVAHTVLDLRELFQTEVRGRFVSEYVRGRTPNPCLYCNRAIKFGAMLDWALAQGADALATGQISRRGRQAPTGI